MDRREKFRLDETLCTVGQKRADVTRPWIRNHRENPVFVIRGVGINAAGKRTTVACTVSGTGEKADRGSLHFAGGKGHIKIREQKHEDKSILDFEEADEIADSESVDKFSIQLLYHYN